MAEKWAGKLDDGTKNQVWAKGRKTQPSDQKSQTARAKRPLFAVGPISKDAVRQTISPFF
jgi:hypothetical protein